MAKAAPAIASAQRIPRAQEDAEDSSGGIETVFARGHRVTQWVTYSQRFKSSHEWRGARRGAMSSHP